KASLGPRLLKRCTIITTLPGERSTAERSTGLCGRALPRHFQDRKDSLAAAWAMKQSSLRELIRMPRKKRCIQPYMARGASCPGLRPKENSFEWAINGFVRTDSLGTTK